MDIQDAMAVVLKKITVLLNFLSLSSLLTKFIVSYYVLDCDHCHGYHGYDGYHF
jgi:hypothetical protein